MDRSTDHKEKMTPLHAVMRDFDESAVREALGGLCTSDAVFHQCHPFGDFSGPDAYCVGVPVRATWPTLELRDWIVTAGQPPEGPMGRLRRALSPHLHCPLAGQSADRASGTFPKS